MFLRRKFLKVLGISILTFISLPYKFLYSATKKIINKNLSKEQKNIMFNEGTDMTSHAYGPNWGPTHRPRTGPQQQGDPPPAHNLATKNQIMG